MSLEDIKVYILSLFSFTLTYTTLDQSLKIIVLLIAIGYGLDKWITQRKNKFKDK